MDDVRPSRPVARLGTPTLDELSGYLRRWRLEVPRTELTDLRNRLADALEVVARLDSVPAPTVPIRYPDREVGREPSAADDPWNAVIRFCDVAGADHGPLADMRIGVKDNIAVAGIPMTEGERALTAIPSEDAVVVERLLDAGATIVAKTNINLGPEPDFGTTRNPLDIRFAAGSSSSGSAAAVAAGLVDAALGVDQGGSIREPAAWCGLVGMKATHGLVPTYGLAYWDHTLDCIGPMTRTVADNATMLEVISGADWRDPQWVRADPIAGSYRTAAHRGVKGLRIGIVTESLTRCSAGTMDAFERACGALRGLGAEVAPVSVPLWTHASIIWMTTIACRLTTLGDAFGQGYGHLGRINASLLSTVAAQYREGTRHLPWLGRVLPVVFEHLQETDGGRHFGLAQNLRLELRRQIDTHLGRVDLLVTPTTPTGPPLLADLPRRREPLFSELAAAMTNTAVSLSGHPALTVPSGPGDDGLPTGLQVIGRRFDEHTVYRAGFAFEGNQVAGSG